MVVPEALREAAATPAMVGGTVSLLTVTTTGAEVVTLPAASRATAVSEWLPLPVLAVFQEIVYGAAVTSAPKLTPSSLNCTPTTPTLSEALALTATAAATVEAAAGAVIATLGGAPSTLLPLPTSGAEAARLPAASRATAVTVWLPLTAVPACPRAPA